MCGLRDLGPRIEPVAIAVGALVVSGLVFCVFLLGLGKNPVQYFQLVWQGGIGPAFSLHNALQHAAPLILTGLAFAIPATIGLTMISAEGARVLGGFAGAAIAVPLVTHQAPVALTMVLMAAVAMATGAAWTAIAGWLRPARGANETIATVLVLEGIIFMILLALDTLLGRFAIFRRGK